MDDHSPETPSSTETETNGESRGPCCPGVRMAKYLAVLAGIGLVIWFAQPNRNDDSTKRAVANRDSKSGTSAGKPGGAVDSAAEQKRLLLGVWQDDYKGKRVLTIRDDGTATMVVEPSGLSARLFAAKLTFEESWSIDDDHLTMKVTGGEPTTRVNLILKTMGDSTTQRILKLTKSRLRLLDEDGETEYDWRRVESSDAE
jgi:hypothetical protein